MEYRTVLGMEVSEEDILLCIIHSNRGRDELLYLAAIEIYIRRYGKERLVERLL